MPDTRDAVALRAFSHDTRSYAKGDAFTLAPNQFEDWKSIGFVEAATPTPSASEADHQVG